MSSPLHVLPLSAAELLDGFTKIALELSSDTNLELTITTALPQFDFRVQSLGRDLLDDAKYIKFRDESIAMMSLPATSSFMKNNTSGRNFSVYYKVENNQTFLYIEDAGTREIAVKVMLELQKHFKLMSRAGVVGASLPYEQQEMQRAREEAISSLTSQVSRLGQFLTEMAAKNAEAVRSLTTDLEKRYQEKEAASDLRIRAQQDELDEARKAFATEKAAFNDRQRTHVRRDLLKEIKANIAQQATEAPVSYSAKTSRVLIHLASGIIGSISLAAIAVVGRQILSSSGAPPFDWRLLPLFSAAAIAFVGTIIFYFRWNSVWADRLAHQDFQRAQYATDILRASWIAELLFEYKDEKGKELAPEVLTSFAEGLFRREDVKHSRYHPMDDLSLFLRRIQSVKAGPESLEITAGGSKK